MSFRRTFTALARGGPVTQAYHARIAAGNLRPDDEQLSLASRLDSLHQALQNDLLLLPDDHLDAAAQFLGASSSSTSMKSNVSSHVSSLLGRIGNNSNSSLAPALRKRSPTLWQHIQRSTPVCHSNRCLVRSSDSTCYIFRCHNGESFSWI